MEKSYNMLAVIGAGVASAVTGILFINKLDEDFKRYRQELALLKAEDEQREQQQRAELNESLNGILKEYSEFAAEKLTRVEQQPASSAADELKVAAKALHQVGFFSATSSLEDKCDLAEQVVAQYKQAEQNEDSNRLNKPQEINNNRR